MVFSILAFWEGLSSLLLPIYVQPIDQGTNKIIGWGKTPATACTGNSPIRHFLCLAASANRKKEREREKARIVYTYVCPSLARFFYLLWISLIDRPEKYMHKIMIIIMAITSSHKKM